MLLSVSWENLISDNKCCVFVLLSANKLIHQTALTRLAVKSGTLICCSDGNDVCLSLKPAPQFRALEVVRVFHNLQGTYIDLVQSVSLNSMTSKTELNSNMLLSFLHLQ